ncbi:Elongator complex protein 6 [Hibiscus syriacus]|uniref:Elongator complex protein 6 n=1 Tax=Hibiscus syriacus TaxID=106335 RepID=A0A6A3C6I2_HIBSY|nr:elongator complex protein 6-like [Hibiscus syriacus]KAE8724334.1 Elongator complex protein 6 [Hibiscus syriacus]
MNQRSSSLLDEALGLDQVIEPWPLRGRVLTIEDRVETSGSFVLHHLLKRSLSPNSSNVSILIAFSQPFSHYDRVLRKLGCNLVSQRDNGRFLFFDMLKLQCPVGDEGITPGGGLIALFGKIHKTISALPEISRKNVSIIIDDLSLMEVAANGSSNYVLDFLHYCRTLTSEFDCSLITLNHEDIYSIEDGRTFLLQMEYSTDILIKVEPLATGLAADVHGQLTVSNKGRNKASNFHFKVKENVVECFYPGRSRD